MKNLKLTNFNNYLIRDTGKLMVNVLEMIFHSPFVKFGSLIDTIMSGSFMGLSSVFLDFLSFNYLETW